MVVVIVALDQHVAAEVEKCDIPLIYFSRGFAGEWQVSGVCGCRYGQVSVVEVSGQVQVCIIK